MGIALLTAAYKTEVDGVRRRLTHNDSPVLRRLLASIEASKDVSERLPPVPVVADLLPMETVPTLPLPEPSQDFVGPLCLLAVMLLVLCFMWRLCTRSPAPQAKDDAVHVHKE